MGKGYKRKTRWRTLNIGAPPGEEDEEDGIRNGYVKEQENGTSSRNGQAGHKTGRTDSAGSTTSDYASDYASAASRSRRDDSGGSPSQPKIIFNENEYTRITTPRQDVLFKKGYLSRKKVWASTASTSATPSTTESQSASHSTADGSETTEDQQLLDCKENGAEEYPAMMEPGAQVAYGTFYDHASGYYYEYPVMVVGPGHGIPGGPPMHNILTAVPCGPVPLRPIEWVNPAFVPKLGNEQYCVVDYQTVQVGQYPTLVDENGVPLTEQTDNTNDTEEVCHENENGSASWTGSLADEEHAVNNGETENGTTEISTTEVEEVPQTSVNSEIYMETALAQQLHMTHVAVSPIPEPYVYPGHYMFGPSLVNVNGVTIQSGPMVRNTGITGAPTNTGACAKRRKKKKLSRRKSRRPLGPGNAEDEEQEEEEYSSEAENLAAIGQTGNVNEAGTAGNATIVSTSAGMAVTTSVAKPLNPECQEFRPVLESRIAAINNEISSGCETTVTSQTSTGPSSSEDSTDKEQQRLSAESEIDGKSPIVACQAPIVDGNDQRETNNSRLIAETSTSVGNDVETANKLVPRQQSEEIVAAPVDFAAEVFANVSIMAERALAPRNVVEGTPMETEIGLDATSVDFQEIVEKLEIPTIQQTPTDPDDTVTNGRRHDKAIEERIASNGVDERRSSCERTSSRISETLAEASKTKAEKRQRDTAMNEKRGSRSASPGMINRTTTPINANSQRLPESYESLVTRGGTNGVSCSLPCVGASLAQQQSRNRKYTSKTPKFVREATPGPDLDATQSQATSVKVIETRMRNDKANGVNASEITTRVSCSNLNNDPNDDEAIATGIEALEGELQRYSLTTTEGGSSYAWEKRGNNADVSNDDSGVESQTRLSSEHPITDAVTEWLQRANSPELFVTTAMITDSEPEDDELENEEPPKNLQGNPMPALSANSSGVNDSELSRLASLGKFASFIDVNVRTTNDTTIERKACTRNGNIDGKCRRNDETSSSASRRKRRGDNNRRVTKKNASVEASKVASYAGTSKTADDINVKNSFETASQRLLEDNSTGSSGSEVEKKIKVDEVCELTENDSVAGMRVAKSSRTKKNMASMMSSTANELCKRRALVAEKTRRSRTNDKTNKVIATYGRDVPIENVEVKMRRTTGDENDEGIVEDEEVSVRTFEMGQIVVSIEGKVLPVDTYQPIALLQNNAKRTLSHVANDERPKFSEITCEKSRTADEINGDEASASEDVSKRNSLGSIEEPDVLECWEVETVEPVATPKRTQTGGTSFEGEDAEDDVDAATTTIDPAGAEIVRKYYRLEAMRDSGTSVTSIDDYYTDDKNNIDSRIDPMLTSTEPMLESISSDGIPVIGERMNKIVEIMLERSGIPIDEAVEVYESCYGGKQPAYIVGLDAKYRSANLYGQDPEREGAVPCKAACCNIQ